LTQHHEENRREERFQAALRVDLGDATGVTRDVSASGIFFETDAALADDSPISFAIDIDTPGGRMVLSCQGEIVRVERKAGRMGVAVKILDSVLRPALDAVGVPSPA